MKKVISILALLFLGTIGWCGGAGMWIDYFSGDLYQELAKENEGNLAFSPYSISTALTMTYLGTEEDVEEEMRKVLYLEGDKEDIASSFGELQRSLLGENGENLQIEVANSIWLQGGFEVRERYLALVKEKFLSELYYVDFAGDPEGSRIRINKWVEEKTEGKIKELIAKGLITPLTRLVLCNAIYFKGKWEKAFDKEMTVEREFYVSEEKTVQVKMMHARDEFRYKDFGRYKGLELPYQGGRLAMVVFLPKEVEGIGKVERELRGKRLIEAIDGVINSPKEKVKVALPRFKVEGEFKLNDVLKRMGMVTAFEGSDFAGIDREGGLQISAVVHKAVVEVNEEGTEAAAATAVVVSLGMVGEVKEFVADHPFVFVIVDKETKTILFMGRVKEV